MSHFGFLRGEWPAVHEAAVRAEAGAIATAFFTSTVLPPPTSCKPVITRSK